MLVKLPTAHPLERKKTEFVVKRQGWGTPNTVGLQEQTLVRGRGGEGALLIGIYLPFRPIKHQVQGRSRVGM